MLESLHGVQFRFVGSVAPWGWLVCVIRYQVRVKAPGHSSARFGKAVVVPHCLAERCRFDSSNRHGASIAYLSMTRKAEPRRRVGGACPVRVLVVEDFAAFRQFICLTLGNSPVFRVIGEASDGLEAIQMQVELRPDLILLDIGLPSLNGIEVARQMRSLVPVTQESSADVVQEAFSIGAQGYVTKNMLLADLFAAVETVLSGKTFVSSTKPN